MKEIKRKVLPGSKIIMIWVMPERRQNTAASCVPLPRMVFFH